MQIRIKSE